MTVRNWLIENSFKNGKVEIVKDDQQIYIGDSNQLSESLLDTKADKIILMQDRVICDISEIT